MNKIKIIAGILSVFLTIPIFVYLFYKIMVLVGASELMWFLFWIYVPIVLIVATLKTLVDE